MAKRQNLFTYSEELSNSLVPISSTFSLNAIDAPDGTHTADGLISTTTLLNTHTGYRADPAGAFGGWRTTSVFAKAGSVPMCAITADIQSKSGIFDLVNGVVFAPNAVTVARIEAYPGGWYRCSISYLHTSAGVSGTRLYAVNAAGALTFADPNIVTPMTYFWGLQCEEQNYPGPYTPTAAAAINTGNLRNASYKKQNLLTFSEQISNAAWNKNLLTVVPDAGTAPDGMFTADLVYPTSTGINRYIWQSFSSAARNGDNLCYSIYAKAAGKTWLAFIDYRFNNTSAWFDLTNGVIGASSLAAVNARMEAVGGGWYRCWIAYTPAQVLANAYILVVDANGSSTSTTNGTDGILVWGAQGVIANHPGPYVPTTSAVVNTGNTRNAPQKKQNLFTYSQTFQNVIWTKQGCTALDNQAIAPDGTLTAALITDSATVLKWVRSGGSVDVGATRTMSFYGKAGTMRWVVVYPNNATTGFVNFDLATGTLGVVTAHAALLGYGIESVGNGWYRCFVTFIRTLSASNDRIYLENANNSASYVGDGTGTWYIWGGQQTLGNNPGPYVLTTAAAINTGNIRQLVQKKQNLITYSEDLSNAAWSKPSATITTGQADPDGGTAACKIAETVDFAYHQVYRLFSTTTNNPVTVSAWFKMGTGRYGVVATQGGAWAVFDLQTGLVTSTTGVGVVASIIPHPVAAGWYRCSLTVRKTLGGVLAYAIVATSDNPVNFNTYNGTVTNYIYVFGVQVVDGQSPGPYTRTTSYVISNGNIRSIAQQRTGQRLVSYLGGTFVRAGEASYYNAPPNTVGGFLSWALANTLREDKRDGVPRLYLSEGTRTNLCLYSEDLNQATWTKTGCTINAGFTAAPDAEVDVCTVAFTADAAAKVSCTVAGTANATTYASSVWARKPAGAGTARLRVIDRNGATTTSADLVVGTLWTRLEYTIAWGTGVLTPEIHVVNGSAGTAQNIETWGMQVEAGAFVSSYMRTTVAAFVRASDRLTFAVYPEAMRRGRWSIQQAPIYPSTVHTTADAIVSFSTTQRDGIDSTNSEQNAVNVNNVPMFASAATTFSADQVMTLVVDMAVATVEVSGATTGNGVGSVGTIPTFPTTNHLAIGSRLLGTGSFFGRIGEPYIAVRPY